LYLVRAKAKLPCSRVAILAAAATQPWELIKILLRHPSVTITSVISARKAIHGSPRSTTPWPAGSTCAGEPLDIDRLVAAGADGAALSVAMPDTVASMSTRAPVGSDSPGLAGLIDLQRPTIWSARPHAYASGMGESHEDLAYLAQAVYGMPEIYGEEIVTAQLIANPGCYPQTGILGLAPLVAGAMLPGARHGIIGR